MKISSLSGIGHALCSVGTGAMRLASRAFMWVVVVVERNPALERRINRAMSVIPGLERLIQKLVVGGRNNIADVSDADGIVWNLPADSRQVEAWIRMVAVSEFPTRSPDERR